MNNSRRLMLSTLSAIALVGFFAGAAPRAQEASRITIGTGGPIGIYFVVGNAICRMMRLNTRSGSNRRVKCAAPPSLGSIDNLRLLREGKVDFAIVQSDWQYHAFNGSSIFENDARADLRSVFSVHVEPFQIVARNGSGIESWDDLRGKRINIGNVGSGHRATFEELIRVTGQDLSSFASVLELESTLQASALCDNEIDAFAFIVGVPSASIAQATDGCDGKIINVNTSEIQELVGNSPYYQWTTVPKGTYFTTTDDVRTLGVLATVVTRADMGDEIVYAVVKSVHENLALFQTLHPAFAKLNSKDMATVGLTALLHPGAIKAYSDLEILE